MNAPHIIHPNAVYDRDAVVLALGLPEGIVDHNIRLGRLRSAKYAGRHFIIGQWLLDWIEAAELKNGQQELCFDPNDPPPAATSEPTVETEATDCRNVHRKPQIASARETLSESQEHSLTDSETQETYRAEYVRQIQQRSCPGCGESEQLF
jgi:hypothetical protein